MPSRRPLLPPIVVTIVFALVCIRLGFWQLGRLEERRTWNTHLEQRLAAAPKTRLEIERFLLDLFH